MNTNKKLNPGLLELDLFCKGMKIDGSCELEKDARMVTRTRAGLGSGLEIIIPAHPEDIYMNVPLLEKFVKDSPYMLIKRNGEYIIIKEGEAVVVIRLPRQPAFYTQKTSNGTLMSRVGTMQGTYLAIYPAQVCGYWKPEDKVNCRFCSTGLNVGYSEEGEKRVQDVVETAIAAKKQEGVTFVHFNTGYYDGNELDIVEPYVRAIKEEAGLLVGVQCPPCKELSKYHRLKELGVDHLSFCFELYNPEYFQKYCPGKHRTLTQQAFFDAMEYTSRLWGKGRVSGEIIAGIEPIEDTLKAIDYITSVGAFPTICVFRPTLGTEMEDYPSPKYEDMAKIFRRMYEALIKNNIPIGIAPNIHVSLVVQPTEGKYFIEQKTFRYYKYQMKLSLLKMIYRPLFRLKMMRHK
ncbi:MAG TPA: radical SAM protein [Candidatus Wunengus californicus]|uniref:radical SAM protein n=1 Tax=Candidatus Wunengus californicus TaxID=3367619 RepID=UPI004029604F